MVSYYSWFTSLLTLMMFVGPKTLVVKVFCMFSGVVVCRLSLYRTPALLISRLRPRVPTTEATCWADFFMLQRSEVSDREKNVEHQW